MSYLSSPPVHPVLACATTCAAALDEVVMVDPIYMSTTDKETALLELAAVASRLDELRLRVLGSADDVAETHGARDAGAWLAYQARLDDPVGRRDLTTARDLQRHDQVRQALREGTIDRARAIVVMRAIDELPHDLLDAETLDKAEHHLVDQAAEFNPARLRNLGRKILQVIAPDVDDEHERRRLEDEEAHARAVTSLHTRPRGDGTTDIRIRCADSVADRLLTYLESLTSPRHQAATKNTSGSGTQDTPNGDDSNIDDSNTDDSNTDEPSTGTGDRRPYSQRLGHAFASLLEHLDPSRLPLHGGDATTVIITIDLQTLLDNLDGSHGGHGVALIGDQPITASEARRLACTAHLIPAVLDGESRPLDVGHSQRLYGRYQRKAMAIRDITCRTQGCTIPAAWCEAHHLTPWAQGGKTDLADGVLLCPHHHHLAHDHRYELRLHPDGSITFHRRT